MKLCRNVYLLPAVVSAKFQDNTSTTSQFILTDEEKKVVPSWRVKRLKLLMTLIFLGNGWELMDHTSQEVSLVSKMSPFEFWGGLQHNKSVHPHRWREKSGSKGEATKTFYDFDFSRERLGVGGPNFTGSFFGVENVFLSIIWGGLQAHSSAGTHRNLVFLIFP
jgi:hypothetical protein